MISKLITDSAGSRIDENFQQVLAARLTGMIHPYLDMGHCREIVMHQDQRIGLALGVLLVGACSAFFFRNETRVLPSAPQLQHARELDERIAERSNRPYMKGIEAVEVADRRRAGGFADAEPALAQASPDQQSAYSWIPFNLFNRKSRNSLPALDPKRFGKLVNPENDVQEFAPITVPSDSQFVGNDHDDQTGESVITDSLPNKSTTLGQGRTYVVQKGDSLSSIAARFLGDRSRYQEVFAANQDQLSDANDVKLGMTLRIPDSQSESVTRARVTPPRSETGYTPPPLDEPVSRSDRLIDSVPPVVDIGPNRVRSVPQDTSSNAVRKEKTQNSESQATTKEAAPKRFVPARRSPLPPRHVSPEANVDNRRSSEGRKLLQISLESTSGKVAR